MKNFKQEKGITMFILVLTVTMLIILTSVAIRLAVEEEGPLDSTKEGVNDFINAQKNEIMQMQEIDEYTKSIKPNR